MSAELLLQVFKLFAGIGLFVFAMYLLEEALKNLSGRSFKMFLKRITRNDLGAVAGGTIVTALLQSSSMVSMIVLAFVGAGIFTLRNAMAIILGANLGTTLASWMVAMLGFKVDIEVASYPAIGLGGMMLIMMSNRHVFRYVSYFLLGFGLLFIGLAFMKNAMEAHTFNLAAYADMPLIAFVLAGFLITLIVQSSSVTMALSLSALHIHAISFPVAAAIVLGSETGTSIKFLVGSMGSNAVKKRVALGSLLMNVIPTLLVFSFLKPLLELILRVFEIKDPLIGLVAFSSLFNVISILLFLPVLGLFTRWLERRYKKGNDALTAFLPHANIEEPHSTLLLFGKEVVYFIYTSMRFNLALFEVPAAFLHENDFEQSIEKRKFFTISSDDRYELLKGMQGEIQAFYIRFRAKLTGTESIRLDRLNAAVRNSMYAVKGIKDIRNDISNLKRSSKDLKFDFFRLHKSGIEALYRNLYALITKPMHGDPKSLQDIFNRLQEDYQKALKDFYDAAGPSLLQDGDLATIINFSREVFASNKAMLMAVKDFVLEENQAQNFNELIVYTPEDAAIVAGTTKTSAL